MTTRNLDELRELIEHLLTQWALHSDGGTYRQPAARRGRSFTGPDVARVAIVDGFARHIHKTAGAVVALIDGGHVTAAAPLVRQMYECALSAVWLIQSADDHGVKALLAEHTRNRRALQGDILQARSAVFREGAEDLPDTDPTPFIGSLDSVRSFKGICLDLEPGGVDAYVYYRLLSTFSHASLGVTDLYFAPSPQGTYAPHRRPVPRTPISADMMLFFAAISMVWGGRAYTYASHDKAHRSILRDAARYLGINAEIGLSDTYRKRHSTRRQQPTP